MPLAFVSRLMFQPNKTKHVNKRHRSFHLARRKAAFSVRIVEPLNKLPPFVINSPSVVVFKNRLDACWESIVGSDEPQ